MSEQLSNLLNKGKIYLNELNLLEEQNREIKYINIVPYSKEIEDTLMNIIYKMNLIKERLILISGEVIDIKNTERDKVADFQLKTINRFLYDCCC